MNSEKLYMNIETGSVGTEDDWWDDENCRSFVGICPELVEVVLNRPDLPGYDQNYSEYRDE